MSSPVAVHTSSAVSRPVLHARFLGILRGEFIKIARLFWLLLAAMTIAFIATFLLGIVSEQARHTLQESPQLFMYTSMESNLQMFRVLSGILLLILTSFTIGREYLYGTIRIVLARGVGRLQLLVAKLIMLALISLAMLVAFSLFIALLTCIYILIQSGNLNALKSLTPPFIPNIGIEMLTIAINMGVTILLASAMNSLTRSLTLGLSISLIWFPVDNGGVLAMSVIENIYRNRFWGNVTTFFLGPLLNRLPDWVLPVSGQSGYQSLGFRALAPVSGPHAFWVILTYSLIFVVLSVVSTWKRDVKE